MDDPYFNPEYVPPYIPPNFVPGYNPDPDEGLTMFPRPFAGEYDYLDPTRRPNDPYIHPRWWETTGEDPWYMTAGKALLGEATAEKMQQGDIGTWVEQLSPLIFMGRAPKMRVPVPSEIPYRPMMQGLSYVKSYGRPGAQELGLHFPPEGEVGPVDWNWYSPVTRDLSYGSPWPNKPSWLNPNVGLPKQAPPYVGPGVKPGEAEAYFSGDPFNPGWYVPPGQPLKGPHANRWAFTPPEEGYQPWPGAEPVPPELAPPGKIYDEETWPRAKTHRWLYDLPQWMEWKPDFPDIPKSPDEFLQKFDFYGGRPLRREDFPNVTDQQWDDLLNAWSGPLKEYHTTQQPAPTIPKPPEKGPTDIVKEHLGYSTDEHGNWNDFLKAAWHKKYEEIHGKPFQKGDSLTTDEWEAALTNDVMKSFGGDPLAFWKTPPISETGGPTGKDWLDFLKSEAASAHGYNEPVAEPSPLPWWHEPKYRQFLKDIHGLGGEQPLTPEQLYNLKSLGLKTPASKPSEIQDVLDYYLKKYVAPGGDGYQKPGGLFFQNKWDQSLTPQFDINYQPELPPQAPPRFMGEKPPAAPTPPPEINFDEYGYIMPQMPFYPYTDWYRQLGEGQYLPYYDINRIA